jgi:hypothetical protein
LILLESDVCEEYLNFLIGVSKHVPVEDLMQMLKKIENNFLNGEDENIYDFFVSLFNFHNENLVDFSLKFLPLFLIL